MNDQRVHDEETEERDDGTKDDVDHVVDPGYHIYGDYGNTCSGLFDETSSVDVWQGIQGNAD